MQLIVTFKLVFLVKIPRNFYLRLVEGDIMNKWSNLKFFGKIQDNLNINFLLLCD